MPWKPSQVRAIAAKMRREGKSPEEIRAFFHRHGQGGGRTDALKAAAKKHRRRK